jgi:hypothetical protein
MIPGSARPSPTKPTGAGGAATGRTNMAGKRKAKRVIEDLSKPSKWRLQHGGFEDAVRGVDPETGCPIAHRRATDSLGLCSYVSSALLRASLWPPREGGQRHTKERAAAGPVRGA